MTPVRAAAIRNSKSAALTNHSNPLKISSMTLPSGNNESRNMKTNNLHLGRVKSISNQLVVSIPINRGEGYKMEEWPISPEQVLSLKIENGMEIRVLTPNPNDTFCNVKEVVEPYGHCHICGERFTYGVDHLRISQVTNWSSQGHPSQDTRNEIDIHPNCFSLALLQQVMQR